MTDGRTDGQTDGRTDGRTDGGDCNIPNAFLKKRGDKKTQPRNKTLSTANILITGTINASPQLLW